MIRGSYEKLFFAFVLDYALWLRRREQQQQQYKYPVIHNLLNQSFNFNGQFNIRIVFIRQQLERRQSWLDKFKHNSFKPFYQQSIQ